MFINGFDAIVDVCTADYPQEFTDLLKITCGKFKRTMSLLELKEHFEFEDADFFQLSASEFCDIYVDLTGRYGQTNYFHGLRVDHFFIFLAYVWQSIPSLLAGLGECQQSL